MGISIPTLPMAKKYADEHAGGGNVDDVKVNGVSVVTDKVANIDLSQYQKYCNVVLTLNKDDDTDVDSATVTVKNTITNKTFGTYEYAGSPITIHLPVGLEFVIMCGHVQGCSEPLNRVIDAQEGTQNVTMTYLTGCVIYSFIVDSTESNPNENITYADDAVGATPAYMDFEENLFRIGSWANAFFMPRPCMLKSDGTVDYYLDPDDYTKKEDGETPSDIANVNYNGNAMMEWGQGGKRIYYKIEPNEDDPTSAKVSVSDTKVDDSYKCWSFLDANGNLMEHFYTPIYNGALDNSSKLRSLSGMTPCNNKNGTAELNAAHANNTTASEEWATEVFCDIILINILLVLIGRSTNTQATFGYGYNSGGTAASSLMNTGTMNTKGLFWGASESTTNTGVKVFGMEHWWGNIWRRYQGHVVTTSKNQLYKLTYSGADGSTAGYNSTGSGYLNSGIIAPNDFIMKMFFKDNGLITQQGGGASATTYYCDYGYVSNVNGYAFRGGSCSNGLSCGAFACGLVDAFSSAYWSRGAALSCKPLA